MLGLCVVDGQVKCENWIRDDENLTEGEKTTWWLNRLMGRPKKVNLNWPFPFAEDKLFILTLYAGLEGFHVNVDGRHVSSFPYRPVSNVLIFQSFVRKVLSPTPRGFKRTGHLKISNVVQAELSC